MIDLVFRTINRMKLLVIIGIRAIVSLVLGTINLVVAQDNQTTNLDSTVGNESNYPSDGTSKVTTLTDNSSVTFVNYSSIL